jgi:hypothetical protein
MLDTRRAKRQTTAMNGEGLGSIPVKSLDDAIDDTLNAIFRG